MGGIGHGLYPNLWKIAFVLKIDPSHQGISNLNAVPGIDVGRSLFQ
jgi:hypothetical protein